MKANISAPQLRTWCTWSVLSLAVVLAACSSDPKKPEPAALSAVRALQPAKQVWQLQIGEVDPMTTPAVKGNALFVANAKGVVQQIQTESGRVVWRVDLGVPVSAGVGSDGEVAAVVTADNELVVIGNGKEIWRKRVGARVFTAPLVAGKRVFVLSADRTLQAYDAANGARLWSQQNRGNDALVLQQPGALLAVGDTLVAGIGGRLNGFNPDNGSQRWTAAIANPRGTNEVERLVDVVGRVGRVDDQVCARAFQSAVGCVDAARGTLQWTKAAVGALGVHADDEQVYGIEGNGRVVAWKRAAGEQAWANEQLLHRGLTAPLAAGRSIVVGDAQGYLHLLSRADGSLLNRLSTDGSSVVYAPLLAGKTLLAVTREGGVFAWRPE